VWIVGDGAEFEREEDSDEPIYYGRCKSVVFTKNFSRFTVVINMRKLRLFV